MEYKIVKAAKEAKADGYEYMSCVVLSVYAEPYYHVVAIDDIISKGRWIPCQKKTGFRLYSPLGGTFDNLPDKCISKALAISKYCK